MQLRKVMLLLFEIVGARTAGNFNAIKWPMHQLKDAVKQKVSSVTMKIIYTSFVLLYSYVKWQ